jgi:hypothetical protein
MHGMADCTAVDYVMAGVLLCNNSSTKDCRLVGPAIVCFSFAIELNLKSILIHLNINPGKVHSIFDLFNLLPDYKKKWLLERYVAHCGEMSMSVFKTEIEKWSNIFVEVRYCHDQSSKDGAYFDFNDFIPNLSVSIHNSFIVNDKYGKISLMSKVGSSSNKAISAEVTKLSD